MNNRNQEQQKTNAPPRLDFNTFRAPPPSFDIHLANSRLLNRAVNRRQYRHDILEIIQQQKNSKTISTKFSTLVRNNKKVK